MRHLVIIAIIIFSNAGCAFIQRRLHPTPPPAQAQTPGEPIIQTRDVPKDLKLTDQEYVAEVQDFRIPLYEWLKRNPNAGYSKLAKEAQKMIFKSGILYAVSVKDLETRNEHFQVLKLKDGRAVLFNTQGGFETPCGDYLVYVSVVRFENNSPVILTNRGPIAIPPDSKGIYFEKTLARRSPEEAPTIFYRPGTDAPWNVSTDAKSLYWQYDLRMSLLENWWKKLTRRYRELREERPYMMIKINNDGFFVEPSEKALLPAFYEQVDPGNPESHNVVKRIYKPKGVIVEYAGHCL